ncbi:DNA primase [Ruminobacter sp.]|uniref:DNA primase n=1 Tax=Ruminobacter sp. TaxID=2774296 RepID=UPI00386D3AE1
MPRIKESFINELLNRVDIVDVISSRIKLKKTGSGYMACCPFHSEKTPSFSVSQQKQFFNCFGCHEAGNAYHFIMKYDNVSFAEAVETVAGIAGVSVEYDEHAKYNHEKSLGIYELTKAAAGFYHQELFKHPEARSYLQNRGITQETIEKYQIGFAPNSWDFIYKALCTDNHGDTDRTSRLLDIGLIKVNETGRHYDMFRNRVIIPIRDKKGNVIAFGGRVLDNSKPKYINSKESEIYKKGYELFNLDYVRKLPREELDCIIITEGYMDVIALDQYGVHNAVASLGTATTPMQLELLFKQTDRIVFCYDGDDAGRHAAWRAFGLTLSAVRDDKTLSFCFLPKEHDPDSLVREQGAEGFRKYLEHSLYFKDYLLSELSRRFDLGTDEGQIKAVDEFCGLVNQITDAPVMVQSLIVAMAKLVGWEEIRIEMCLQNKKSADHNREPQVQKTGATGAAQLELTPIRGLVARIIQNPYLVNCIPEQERLNKLLNEYADEKAKIVLDVLSKINAKPDITTGALLEQYRGTVYERIMNLLAAVQMDDSLENVKISSMLSFIKIYLSEAVEAKIAWLRREATRRNLTDEELALSTLLEQKLRNLK